MLGFIHKIHQKNYMPAFMFMSIMTEGVHLQLKESQKISARYCILKVASLGYRIFIEGFEWNFIMNN